MQNRAGENIEYLRIIVDNTIELYKLKGISAISGVISKILLVSFVGLSIAATVLFVTALVTVMVGQYTGNWVLGIICGGSLNIIFGLILAIFRETLILKPMKNFLIEELID